LATTIGKTVYSLWQQWADSAEMFSLWSVPEANPTIEVFSLWSDPRLYNRTGVVILVRPLSPGVINMERSNEIYFTELKQFR
jgi:hypothetical protein